MTDPTRPPGIHLEQVFVDEVQFKHRKDALSLPFTTPVELTFRVEWRSSGERGSDQALCQIRFVTTEPEKQLYSISVGMTALIGRITGHENMDPLEYAEEVAPAMMIPYLREAVADLTRRGRFGAVNFPPINVNLAGLPAPEGPRTTQTRKRKKKT